MKSATFFPAPAECSSVHSVRIYSGQSFWGALSEDIAETFQCEPDDLRIEDCSWLDGERFADFVTLDGRIIGSIDEHLTPSEWTHFYATRQVSPDDAPAISGADILAASNAADADAFIASLDASFDAADRRRAALKAERDAPTSLPMAAE